MSNVKAVVAAFNLEKVLVSRGLLHLCVDLRFQLQGPETNDANARFWITPGGALLVAYTVSGAEVQTSVPMTTGTLVTVETRQFRLQDQVTGRHTGAPD